MAACPDFNSIKVRLKLRIEHTRLSGKPHFNSIKVRLKQKYSLVVDKYYQNFNSIKVRLKLYLLKACLWVCFDFNSIKVRLKHTWVNPGDTLKLFQFHKGTIKTIYLCKIGDLIRNFNSIKVRLKRVDGAFNGVLSSISIP